MSHKKPISASEINRYTYCPYQWYYERIYGTKELRRLAKEQKFTHTPKNSAPYYESQQRMQKGNAYHKEHYAHLQTIMRRRRIALMVGVIGVLLFLVVCVGMMVL